MSLVFSKTAGSYPAATPEDPMKDSFDPFDDSTSEKEGDEEDDAPKPGVPFPTKYEFADVDIPADFLSMTNPPPDAKPITFEQIDFAQTVLPQFKGRYAVVLDNVLSPSECTALLQLAEQSVPVDQRGKNGDRFWRPALVNVGNGLEVLESDYRRSDRIIWDQQEVVDRLWARCLQAPQIKERLQAIENEWDMLDLRSKRARGMVDRVRWEFRCLNKRMRFLRYRPGGFFRPHCDGPYTEPTGPGENVVRTLLTVHLYLNDSQAEVGQDAADLVGGATSFLSFDETKKMDVNPRAGRVLIFQHAGLYHSGDDVLAGTKYTMRTDILYEKVLYE